MMAGQIKFASFNEGAFHVLFFRQDVGGSVRAHAIHGLANLRRFMETLGCPLSEEQVLDAEQMKLIRGTQETKHAEISADNYERYFA